MTCTCTRCGADYGKTAKHLTVYLCLPCQAIRKAQGKRVNTPARVERLGKASRPVRVAVEGRR